MLNKRDLKIISEPIWEKLIKVIDPGSPKITNDSHQRSKETTDDKQLDNKSIISDK